MKMNIQCHKTEYKQAYEIYMVGPPVSVVAAAALAAASSFVDEAIWRTNLKQQGNVSEINFRALKDHKCVKG